MAIDFNAAVQEIGGDEGVLTIANQARVPANYLLASILPERQRAGYEATAGSMSVKTTMAGMVGMDSTYPEVGAIALSTFREQIGKFASQTTLTEQMIRELQAFVDRAILDGASSTDVVVNTLLNGLNKLILQAHFDRAEWLRGQALFTGELAWTFNGISLALDYGIPSANVFPTRTSTSAYGGSASVFWSDVKAAKRILKNRVFAMIGNSTMVDEIIYNEANALEVVGQTDNTFRIRRLVGSGVNQRPSTNAMETVDLISYDGEGSVRDPANPNNTLPVQFVPDGVMGVFARPSDRTFEIGQGSTPDPESRTELGYTHLGPTIENNGRLGRWARIFKPEEMQMNVIMQGAENSLPVIRNPDLIVLMSTALS